MTRKMAFLTGIRSDYDIQASVMKAVQQSGVEVGLIVSGAHCAASFGNTSQLVAEDHFPIIAKVESLLNSESRAGRAKSLAIQLTSVIDVLSHFKPDLIFAAMDREEAMTMALAGTYLKIPVAHLGGGDITGDGVDDSIRRAVTQLAHLHFTHTEASAARVHALGVAKSRIFNVGAPGLDRLKNLVEFTPEDLWQRLGFTPETDYALVLHHPDFIEDECGSGIDLIMQAILDNQLAAIIGLPNSDPGQGKLTQEIQKWVSREPRRCFFYQNLPHSLFLNLMRHAKCLLGNTSCGLVEAPFFGLQVVSPGPRQKGREAASNVIFVDYNLGEISSAVKIAAFDRAFRERARSYKSPYGDGNAGAKIAAILSELEVTDSLFETGRERK